MTVAECHTDADVVVDARKAAGRARVRVAIAGNPNTGKTTLLNHLVGANFTVGNWPGVTVEKKQGQTLFENTVVEIVDLPGVYTLEPVSEDEQIASTFLTTQRPDVLLNVIETPNLERDLGLTVELSALGIPMVAALNMADEAARGGMSVDCARFQTLTGIAATPTVGRTGQGTKALLPLLLAAARAGTPPRILAAGPALQATRAEAAERLAQAVTRQHGPSRRGLTARLDALFLHPILGVGAYLAIMYLFFKIAFDMSAPFMDWLDGFMNGFLGPLAEQGLLALNAPPILAAFVGEAIIGGVGFTLTFMPLIAVMFFLLTMMGMSGYMARLPFVLDRFMRRFGLNGKAVIPLMLGMGCNVPAIMATRTMESRRDRVLVTMMIPFISCPARLVIYAFFAALFFPNPALVIIGLYLGGVVIAALTSLLLKRSVYRNEATSMLIELPPYRLPRLRTVLVIVWSHVREFLRRAGTVIFAVSVIVWSLAHVPFGATPENSVLGAVGKAITPVFEPIGIRDWRVTTSLIPAFLARETALSFMATVYSAEDTSTAEPIELGPAAAEQAEGLVQAFVNSAKSLFTLGIDTLQTSDDIGGSALRETISKSMTPATALSFMVLMLLYNSCLAVASVMARELGRKASLGFLAYSFIVGWLAAFGVYWASVALGG